MGIARQADSRLLEQVKPIEDSRAASFHFPHGHGAFKLGISPGLSRIASLDRLSRSGYLGRLHPIGPKATRVRFAASGDLASLLGSRKQSARALGHSGTASFLRSLLDVIFHEGSCMKPEQLMALLLQSLEHENGTSPWENPSRSGTSSSKR